MRFTLSAAASRARRRPGNLRRQALRSCCMKCGRNEARRFTRPTAAPSSSARIRFVPMTRSTTPSVCCTRKCAGSTRSSCALPTRNQVPAGGALAVDRDGFSEAVSTAISAHPMIELKREEITLPPDDWDSVIIATARSPGSVRRTPRPWPRSTRRGGRLRGRRCRWGRAPGGGGTRGSVRCGAACGCGTRAWRRRARRPAASRARLRPTRSMQPRSSIGSTRSKQPGHDLEPAVVGVGVVDRHHGRHVVGDHRVHGRVLVRRVARAAGELVVDLLLVEHRRFAEQRARGVEHRTPRSEQRPAAPRAPRTKCSLRHSCGPPSVCSRCWSTPDDSGSAGHFVGPRCEQHELLEHGSTSSTTQPRSLELPRCVVEIATLVHLMDSSFMELLRFAREAGTLRRRAR